MDRSGDIQNDDHEDTYDLCYPECEENLKPRVDQIFNNLDEGYKFYNVYAAECGFKTRKSTIILAKDGTVRTRYVLCTREGLRESHDDSFVGNNEPAVKKRKRTSSRVDCMAHIVFKIASYGRYRVSTFNEGHTHSMVSHGSRHLMTSNMNVDNVHQMFILSGIKVNIGPMRTFRFYKELVGSYESVGCTSIDFKNFARDLRVFSDGSDAHMLLEDFKSKQQYCKGFKFFYDVDNENKLRRLLWADDVSVTNFKLFGQAVSFDATYNTNKYKMIFTPFTGRDNHGRCVTFGAAIISHEDINAYSWVLEKFVECMGSAPSILITDQDPGLKKAILAVWPNTYHRYCMWHITMKLTDKLPVYLRDNSDFKGKFGNIVWSDYDEPADFEEKWNNLMEEYGLSHNRWFCDMFELRFCWIPAYFRDVYMSGLFRTTSLSESENSFFRRFFNKHSDLLRLYMNYNSAIEAQRHAYHTYTLADETGVPQMITHLSIERHAASTYTNNIFKDVQVEIEATHVACVMSDMYSEGDNKIYLVDDNVDGTFKVCHNKPEDYLSCACKLFTRKGLLCRHMFFVMRTLKVNKIPDKYVVQRWCKKSKLLPIAGEMDLSYPSDGNTSVGNHHFFMALSRSIGHVSGNKELRKRLLSDLEDIANKYEKLGTVSSCSGAKQMAFEEFYGSRIPDAPNVLPPDVAKTKGSGVGGRRKSLKEKAYILSQKPMRMCKKCDTLGHHDSRICPGKDVVKD